MVEVDVYMYKGMFCVMVLSGVFMGIYEVVEFCDGGKEYMGKGVM